MGQKKQLSGAAKRKKQKEKEEAIAEAAADLERLKLGPTALWTGLVLHHRDIFVSHVLPKLNETDQFLFADANTESWDLLEYAGIDVSKQRWAVHECSSISTLEWAWNFMKWGEKFDDGTVRDHAWFCKEVARTNKLELLKWVREEKKCEWDEDTINAAALVGNLEMLKYCFANDCPYDEMTTCDEAAGRGYLDCLRFLFNKVKPSDDAKADCVVHSVFEGHLDCLKYLGEEAKAPLDDWRHIAHARYFEHTECLHYLREKGCPELTDEQYATVVNYYRANEQR